MPEMTTTEGVAEPVAAPVAPVQETVDPFALEEQSLASLSPEQRASLDPILTTWREKAKTELEKASKSAEEKYAPVRDKAEALERLTQWQPFQQWWSALQNQASQGQSAPNQQAISQTRPQDVATAPEWQQAVIESSNGDPARLQMLIARAMSLWSAPVIQQMNEERQELSTRFEMKELMDAHPDYKELDQIGLDEKNQGVSLLEHALNWAEENRKPLEEGYQLAKRWANSMKSGAQAQAMGIVQGKKDSVVTGPSTAQGGGTVVYVDTLDEAVKRSMDDTLSGVNKGVRYEVKKPSK